MVPGRTLVTFPPSLDGELARFLLAHHGLSYTEERHTLIFSSVVTLWRARTVRFPVLFADGVVLDEVREMISFLEGDSAPDRRLVPNAGDRVWEDWSLFNGTLGSGTTVLAYFHLLPLRGTMSGPLSDGAPAIEVSAVHHAYWLFAGLLRLLLRLTTHREQAARHSVDAVMTVVDNRLSDGRSYLQGDDFTLSDMAFAVAAAPIVWPDEYGGGIPSFHELPPALRDIVVRMRERPSGQHALRVYRELRVGSNGR